MANHMESKIDNEVSVPIKLIPAISRMRANASFIELKSRHSHIKPAFKEQR